MFAKLFWRWTRLCSLCWLVFRTAKAVGSATVSTREVLASRNLRWQHCSCHRRKLKTRVQLHSPRHSRTRHTCRRRDFLQNSLKNCRDRIPRQETSAQSSSLNTRMRQWSPQMRSHRRQHKSTLAGSCFLQAHRSPGNYQRELRRHTDFGSGSGLQSDWASRSDFGLLIANTIVALSNKS